MKCFFCSSPPLSTVKLWKYAINICTNHVDRAILKCKKLMHEDRVVDWDDLCIVFPFLKNLYGKINVPKNDGGIYENGCPKMNDDGKCYVQYVSETKEWVLPVEFLEGNQPTSSLKNKVMAIHYLELSGMPKTEIKALCETLNNGLYI